MCNAICLSTPDEDLEKFGADGHLLATTPEHTSKETREETSVEFARFIFSFYIR